jgi:lipid A 3-O-deacylase
VAPGMAVFGSPQAHDLALLSLSYGHMLGHVKGEGHWYRGNFEGRLELFGGGEYSPADEWVIGLTPHLRYNFATGARWVRFLDIGAGVTATGIGSPDLSGIFEFNLQAAAGVHWFLRDNFALTGEVRLMHLSCAGIHSPNLGANNVAFMIGVTWFLGK